MTCTIPADEDRPSNALSMGTFVSAEISFQRGFSANCRRSLYSRIWASYVNPSVLSWVVRGPHHEQVGILYSSPFASLPFYISTIGEAIDFFS